MLSAKLPIIPQAQYIRKDSLTRAASSGSGKFFGKRCPDKTATGNGACKKAHLNKCRAKRDGNTPPIFEPHAAQLSYTKATISSRHNGPPKGVDCRLTDPRPFPRGLSTQAPPPLRPPARPQIRPCVPLALSALERGARRGPPTAAGCPRIHLRASLPECLRASLQKNSLAPRGIRAIFAKYVLCSHRPAVVPPGDLPCSTASAILCPRALRPVRSRQI
jgi:hypothetical protein